MFSSNSKGFLYPRLSTPNTTTTTYVYLLKVPDTQSAASDLFLPHHFASSIIPVNSGLDCAMAYCYFTHIINVIHAYSDKPQDSQQHSQYLLFKQFKMVVLLYPICKTPDQIHHSFSLCYGVRVEIRNWHHNSSYSTRPRAKNSNKNNNRMMIFSPFVAKNHNSSKHKQRQQSLQKDELNMIMDAECKKSNNMNDRIMITGVQLYLQAQLYSRRTP